MMRILHRCLAMGGLNKAVLASSLVVLLFATPCWGGGSREGRQHLKRGTKLEKKGQFEKAIEEYGKSIQLDPELEKAWFQRGVLFSVRIVLRRREQTSHGRSNSNRTMDWLSTQEESRIVA